MTFRMTAVSALALSALALCAVRPDAAHACSACGCNLDTDEGSTASGFSVDERVDVVNQNTLWQGGGKAPASLTDPTVGDQHEVQRNTTTIFYTTTVDYQSAERWGVNVAVPAQYRTHSTYNNGDWTASKSEWNALGDVRVLGRYALTEDRGLSLLAGIKLPTGSTQETFRNGATAGSVVDAGLQPGTGTWDLLLGSGQNGPITEQWSWFAQELWQRPLKQQNGFAQGQTLNGSVGVRYAIDETFMPQFQINAQNRWRDQGYNADIPNSGGEVVYASPGLFVTVAEGTSVYGFVQIPVYQRVGGLELVPDYSASLGIKHRF